MAVMPHTVNNQVGVSFDGAFYLEINKYTPEKMFVYSDLENLGKLLYKLGESAYVYDGLTTTVNRMVYDSEMIAYDIWTAIVNCQGNKRGKKTPCTVYVISSETGEIIKHFRFAGKGE